MTTRSYVSLVLQHRAYSLGTGVGLTAIIALLDTVVARNISLGFLHVLPLALASPHLRRRWILACAIALALLREALAPFAWEAGVEMRILLVFAALSGLGLFVHELSRNRRMAISYAKAMEQHEGMRREAEGHLANLVESSPAAMLTVTADRSILRANAAAHQLFHCENGTLPGQPVMRYLPTLKSVLSNDLPHCGFRTSMECDAIRQGGSQFAAEVWFSTFQSPAGPRLAAIVFDTSEALRDREELLFQRSLQTSRILAGAVRHEVRNLCSAIGTVRDSLEAIPGIGELREVQALHALVAGLERLVQNDPNTVARPPHEPTDLQALFGNLRAIADDDRILWRIPPDLPPVDAESDGLLQVFLNLVRNALRAVRLVTIKEICISAEAVAGRISVSVSNSGPPVAAPDLLFQPYQQGAEGTGLGLFVSRAIVRSYGGELAYIPAESGCTFVVDLLPVSVPVDASTEVAT
ncbi:MAG: PAS domain-containing sensor histidine kinase [Acidobacteria bacterium]|nr:PAS domain-containing sensor histidine kinase [Acidobacteriota bacterium]